MDQERKHYEDIETGAGVVRVKKLALKDYAEFIRALRSLPREMAQLFKSDKDIQDMAVLFEELPEILADGFGDLINLLTVVTDKDAEFFDNPDVELADAIEIVRAALELNNYEKIVASIKKIMGRRAAENAPTTQDQAKPAEK